MSWGEHWEPVFLEEADQPFFLSTLQETCVIMTLKTGACNGFVP
jgi:hypothetical protein